MTNTIREPRDSDFFPWLSLYEAYVPERGVELTEQRALQLWTWLTDVAHPESALVSLDENGELVGFAHFHTFPRPLLGETGLFIDALHVSDDVTETDAAAELLQAVRSFGAAHGATVLRWTQAEGERLPAVLNDTAGEASNPTVFELQTAAQPA